MTTVLILLIGAGAGVQAGRWLTRRRAAATIAQAEAEMRRELAQWQEAAARANAEAARVAREAEAYKDGCKHGREDVIGIMPLLVAAQQWPADWPHANGDGSPQSR
jgi:uncharacterized protein YqfA (UPF0365 family)